MQIWQAWLVVVLLGLLAASGNWSHLGALSRRANPGPVYFEESCIGKFPAAQFYLKSIHPLVSAAYYSYIPMAILTICSIVMSFKMKRLGSQIAPSGASSTALKDVLRITRLTLALSGLFIFATFPMMVSLPILRMRLSSFTGKRSEAIQISLLVAVVTVLSSVVLINHAFNLFIYMAFSKQFRKEFRGKCFHLGIDVTSSD